MNNLESMEVSYESVTLILSTINGTYFYEDITKSCVYLHSQDVSPRGFSRDH